MNIGKRTIGLIFNAIAILVMSWVGGGCASSETQVQKAAKDWCMTIRGSQVIPVYPLTEDIQPGDLFLVQVPIDKQQELYDRNGFLPLDNHLARINPDGYDEFYSHSFFPSNGTVELPRDWIRPKGVGVYAGTNNLSWQAAPRVAFPSYTFSVQNGAGLNLAVPVQGVPVGLGLLASDAASGSIQILDARTMGVDVISLYRQVKDWENANTEFLRMFGASPKGGKTNYIRVITRVFSSGRMEVSLKDASNRGGGLDAGVPKAVNLLSSQLPSGQTNTSDAALSNYTNAWNAMSGMVKASGSTVDAAGKVLPGGSLRLAAASSRSVSLDETFDPPVTIGYLGFDCAIGTNGELEAPMPTYAVVNNLPVQQATIRHFAGDASAEALRAWVHPNPPDKDVTKEREGVISAWSKKRDAHYSFADLLYRADLATERQQFIKDNSITR